MLFILFFHTRSIVFKVWSYTFCGKVLAIWDITKVWCHWNLPSWTSYKASHGESFTRVSFAFNSLPHIHFWWHGNVLMKREKNWVSWGWNSLGTVTNSLWVIELNVYETIEWNFPLRVKISSKFHFILYDMAVLETTK